MLSPDHFPSGYVAFSGVTDFGDAAVIIAGLNPHIVWRRADFARCSGLLSINASNGVRIQAICRTR
jgi:hypothetical protein